MKKLKLKKFILVVATAVLLVSACNFNKTNDSPAEENTPNTKNPDATGKEKPTVDGTPTETTVGDVKDDEDEEVTKTPEDSTDATTSKDDKVATTNFEKTNGKTPNKNNGTQTATGQSADVYLNDPELSSKWQMLDEISAAAQTYYSENFNKTRIITKNGYLYNKASEEIIDVKYLVSNGNIPSKYVNVNCDILLIDASEISRYDSMYIKNGESGLIVVAATPHPTKNLYMLTTAKSAGGTVSSAQYAAIINNYYQNHGSVGRVFSDSEEYARILSFISMFESKYENYNVRSITADNKYATVVLSGENNAADVRQYILRRSGGVWEVVMSNLESDPRILVNVNKALPDFNYDMLPAYTINDHLSSLTKDKSKLIEEMVSRGMVVNSADIKYICGTTNFAYIVLKNEIKYICNNTGDSWNIVQVATSDEARKKMLAISGSAPTFIILDR